MARICGNSRVHRTDRRAPLRAAVTLFVSVLKQPEEELVEGGRHSRRRAELGVSGTVNGVGARRVQDYGVVMRQEQDSSHTNWP